MVGSLGLGGGGGHIQKKHVDLDSYEAIVHKVRGHKLQTLNLK